VSHGAPADVGLGHLVHPDRREYARRSTVGLDGVLQRQGVDDGPSMPMRSEFARFMPAIAPVAPRQMLPHDDDREF